jgi:hypothetical protein
MMSAWRPLRGHGLPDSEERVKIQTDSSPLMLPAAAVAKSSETVLVGVTANDEPR